jgi:hypothetical protein
VVFVFFRFSKKRCTRLAAASAKVYQLLAHGRWFSPGTLASSTTKTGRHDIADILLKVALDTKKQSLVLFQQMVKLLYDYTDKLTLNNETALSS